MSDLYPLTLRLTGRRVVVVGGGAVAARRVPRLLAAGAHVVVIDPAPSRARSRAGDQLDLVLRPYASGDLARRLARARLHLRSGRPGARRG